MYWLLFMGSRCGPLVTRGHGHLTSGYATLTQLVVTRTWNPGASQSGEKIQALLSCSKLDFVIELYSAKSPKMMCFHAYKLTVKRKHTVRLCRSGMQIKSIV